MGLDQRQHWTEVTEKPFQMAKENFAVMGSIYRLTSYNCLQN